MTQMTLDSALVPEPDTRVRVTDEEVMAKLNNLVATFPNRTAECVYFLDDAKVDEFSEDGKFLALKDPDSAEAECIVGCLLLDLGVKPADLVRREGVGAFSAIPELVVGISHNLLLKLDRLQGVQDGGESWSEAAECVGLVP